MRVRPDFIVASGSLPPGVPDDFYALVARIAREWQARFIIDTSGKALEQALKEGVYLVKPNLREFKEFAGFEEETDEALVAASREIIVGGMAEVVAVTLGDNGAMLATREHVWRATGPAVKAVSAVGAGDSFLGGLLSGLASGKDMQEALRDAVAAGAAAVLTPGTALSNRSDVERLRPLIDIHLIHGTTSAA
jgi:6-phosphofructokinase 2